MNFHQIKNAFVLMSGRRDLVVDDEGEFIDSLINQACRALDRNRMGENQKSWGTNFSEMSIGDFAVSFQLCRAVKEVWLTSTTARWQMEKLDLHELIYDHLSGDTVDNGTPYYYSPVVTRKVPEDADLSALSSYMTYVDTQTNLGYDYNAIVIVPPTDAAVMCEVKGLFYSNPLVDDTDENYWTSQHPVTLLKSVMRELEVFNQNQGRVKLWNSAVISDVEEISKDLVEELIAEVDQIEN